MKITMLGISGSGKTVYMSAMSELFYNGSVYGYTVANRENDYKSSAFVYKGFDTINTLYRHGRFPAGTSSSIIMPLQLQYRGQKLLDIDWIDYRGGALKELASGIGNSQTAEILATLIASDVVMVFVDAAVLKVSKNVMTARAQVGADVISQLLYIVSKKKYIDIVFLLSKSDSSIIDVKKDYIFLKERTEEIYARFFADTNTQISQYPVIPIGALGYKNVKTTHEWHDDGQGGRVLLFNNTITDYENMNTVNIAASFAVALLKCLNSECNQLNTESKKIAEELEYLENKFGVVGNLLDILFNGSKKRQRVHELKQKIEKSREEIKELNNHKQLLGRIASESR